ncbi:MAG TPA: AraC family ligand binding domain-containing protein, partial [Chthoniobacterales bacterium]
GSGKMGGMDSKPDVTRTNLPSRKGSIPMPDRRAFLRAGIGIALGLGGIWKTLAQSNEGGPVPPEATVFADDGTTPNSRFAVLVYRQAFSPSTPDLSEAIAARFAANGWTGTWRYPGIFTFNHYHSTTHEVLAIYQGSGTLQLGGLKRGRPFDVASGDVILVPAGVGHMQVKGSADFRVLGAFAGGRSWDLNRGLPGERPQADRHIAAVPLPDNDPLFGADGPLVKIWKSADTRNDS